MNRRRTLMKHTTGGSELPPGYTPVKSLTNTVRSGGAYLDTGLIAKGTLKVRIVFKLNAETGFILGGRISNSSRPFTFSASSEYWNDGYFGTFATSEPVDYEKHILVKNKGTTYFDDIRVSSRNDNDFTSGRRLLIFACDNNGTVTNPVLMTVYELQIWDDDVLVRDYRLCTDSNGRPCVYDVVNDTTTYSAGSIDFTYER